MRFNFLLNCNFYTFKVFNLGDITNENKKKHNEKWPYIDIA